MGGAPATRGGSKTSVLNLPQFRIRWNDVDVVARSVTTGMTEKQAEATSVRSKPAVVFIYKDDVKSTDDDPSLLVESHRAFADDSVAIGARFFDCLRIEFDNASKDRVLSKYAKQAPVLVFLRPNLEVAKAIRGRFNARGVFGAMCKTMQLDYENCVRTAVKAQRKLMRDVIKLDKLRAEEAKLSNKIDDTDKASKRKMLERKRVKIEKQIDEQSTAISDREAKIYELEPKPTEEKAAS